MFEENICGGRRRVRSVLLTTSAAFPLLTATPSIAQTSAPDADEDVDRVIVTGSLIARRDFTASSPIVSVDGDIIDEVGALTIDQALNYLPQFVPNSSSTSNFPGFGLPNIQLRGLGPQRTLVLVDGRRFIGNINTIPSQFIDNVEVITGGASAIYGADAIAGVVNVKLRDDFDGFSVDAQAGITERGDGGNYQATLAYGSGFDNGRGRINLGLTHQWRETSFKRDRDFSRISLAELSLTLPEGNYQPFGGLKAPIPNPPSQAAVNSVFGSYGFAPGTVSFASPIGVNNDGTLFNPNSPIANWQGSLSDLRYGLDPQGNLRFNGSFYTPLETPISSFTAFGSGEYELADWVSAYSQFNFTRYHLEWGQGPGNAGAFLWSLAIPATNPFIPDDLQTLLDSRRIPNAPFAYAKRLEAQQNRIDDTVNNTFQMTTGFRGDLPKGWGWDVFASYGVEDITSTHNSASLLAIQELLEAPDGGASICEGGYNPFGDQPVSQECIDYTNFDESDSFNESLLVVQGVVSGDLIALPAGPIQTAVGFTFRKSTQDETRGFLSVNREIPNYIGGQSVNGSQSVTEFFGEILIPVFYDMPFFEALNIGAGYRYSDYELSGGASSYKFDLDWLVAEEFRLRGSYQRAIREPTVGNLFDPPANQAPNIGEPGVGFGGDPCDVRGERRNGPNASAVRQLCLNQGISATAIDSFINNVNIIPGLGGGNRELVPETANTYTIGAIWQPDLGEQNLSLSLDYYNIELEGAIGAISATDILDRCYSAEFNPDFAVDNFYCQFITRSPGGQFTQVLSNLQNLGGFKVSGIDLQIDWNAPIDGLGATLRVNTVWSWLNEFSRQNLPGEEFLDLTGTIGPRDVTRSEDSHPTWKGVTTVGLDFNPASVNLRWRYISDMDDQLSLLGDTSAIGTPTINYLDLFGNWGINDTLTLRAGIINLTDREPPFFTSASQSNTDPATFDVLGRRFYLGVNANF